MSKMQVNFQYAVANGYNRSFNDYLDLNYALYCSTCHRCRIVPMGFAEWKASNA